MKLSFELESTIIFEQLTSPGNLSRLAIDLNELSDPTYFTPFNEGFVHG